MSVSQRSLFDLGVLVEDFIPIGMIDPHTNESIFQFFKTLHLFGVARNCDTFCNLEAAKILFLQFARDICLIEHYTEQLKQLSLTKIKNVQFDYNLSIMLNIVNRVQKILLHVNINDMAFYAPWRFVLYRFMIKCISMIDEQIYRRNFPVYQQMMIACGGVDFLPELQYLCEILQKIGTSSRLYYANECIVPDGFKILSRMLCDKMQVTRPGKHPLTQSWSSSSSSSSSSLSLSSSSSSSSESEDEEEEQVCDLETLQTASFDQNADPIDILLSVQRMQDQIPDDLFENLSFTNIKYKTQDGIVANNVQNDLLETKVILRGTDDVLPIVQSTLKVPIGVEKWRSPLLEAAKEKYRLLQEEKQKKKKRFPYRRQKKKSNVIDDAEKLVAKPEETVKKEEVVKSTTPQSPKIEQKIEKQELPKTPSPEKKKKKQRYNQVWMRK